MAGPSREFERRKLNEEIEDALIITHQTASNLSTKIFSGKGTMFGDLQDFHTHFDYGFRLTSPLREMDSKDSGDRIDLAKKKAKSWLTRKVNTTASVNEIEALVKSGLEAFEEYYYVLMHQGVITMPTKKG